jgi:hypothetical protein
MQLLARRECISKGTKLGHKLILMENFLSLQQPSFVFSYYGMKTQEIAASSC